MKNLITLLIFLQTSSALCASPKILTPIEAKKILCQDIVKNFPGEFKNVNQCMSQSKFKGSSFEREASISFPSCDSGELIIILIDRLTREIQEASTGLDSDACEN